MNNVLMSDEKLVKNNLLDPEFLKLLSKQELSFEEKSKIYDMAVIFFCSNFGMIKSNVEVSHINDADRPISQVGFTIDYDNNCKFNHLISANDYFLQDYPIERIILVACHESAHLEKNERLAKTKDFSKEEDVESYIDEISNNDSISWYSNEEEKRADSRAFHAAKNVFQRAVHDTDDLALKNKFWESHDLLEMNEQIEMEKHMNDVATHSSK